MAPEVYVGMVSVCLERSVVLEYLFKLCEESMT